MPKARPPYTAEFRRQMVDLIRAGRIRPTSPASLNRPLRPSGIGWRKPIGRRCEQAWPSKKRCARLGRGKSGSAPGTIARRRDAER